MSVLLNFEREAGAHQGVATDPDYRHETMTRPELAERLLALTDAGREAELSRYPALADRELAYLLKDQCLNGWTGDSARALAAAATLSVLAGLSTDTEISACAYWANGIAALIGGRMDESLLQLDRAAGEFRSAGLPGTAAGTEASKLIALALLGRYDEALECGLAAREVLTEPGDLLSLGKIEHNLGNIYLRREHFGQAEEFLRHALARFAALGDLKQQSMVQVNLAFIRTLKNDFRAAGRLYAGALEHAVAGKLLVNQADIEANLGTLALYQGKYDIALEYLERARSKFAGLEMPHKSALSEQELADAYLELNLVPEAAAAYDQAAETFYQLGLRAERAQVLAQRGRAAVVLGDFAKAHVLLREAQTLFAAEGNHLGAARVQLTEAQLLYAEGEFAAAAATAHAAEVHLSAAGIQRQAIMAQWLRGDALRRRGDILTAESVLRQALESADLHGPPMVKTSCCTSLGLLFAARGDRAAAEGYFRAAIRLIEELRAPLPAEEFRGAFLADHLTPYHEMMRICLDDPQDRSEEALAYSERAKSRALADLLKEPAAASGPNANDEFALELAALQEELNWYYSQLNRPFGRTSDEIATLQTAVRERETRLEELARPRRLHAERTPGAEPSRELSLRNLQAQLGAEVALVEYALLDDEWLAFVVTNTDVQVMRNIAATAPVRSALDQFRFQIDGLRFGAAAMRRHLPRLTQKIQLPLRALYELLLAPVIPSIGGRRVVIVPQGELHYVPFHALYDGARYVIEDREVSTAPSASVLAHCLSRDSRSARSAVLLGVEDESTPLVESEIEAIAPFFAHSDLLLRERANLSELAAAVSGVDVLHLVCHGQFRPDRPLFSSLRLAHEWMTAREVASLDLTGCGLVTLSACETGLNAINPGDELMGLARGFFAAGAASLLLSQWVVDDASRQASWSISTGIIAPTRGRRPPCGRRSGRPCASNRTHFSGRRSY